VFFRGDGLWPITPNKTRQTLREQTRRENECAQQPTAAPFFPSFLSSIQTNSFFIDFHSRREKKLTPPKREINKLL
jgi:hypothetical protein